MPFPISHAVSLKTKMYFVRSGYGAPQFKMITLNWILKELGGNETGASGSLLLTITENSGYIKDGRNS
jgi:hypothetical protein